MKILGQSSFMKFTCPGCRTKLEAEFADLRPDTRKESARFYDVYVCYVACPTCGRRKYVDETRMTFEMLLQATRAHKARNSHNCS